VQLVYTATGEALGRGLRCARSFRPIPKGGHPGMLTRIRTASWIAASMSSPWRAKRPTSGARQAPSMRTRSAIRITGGLFVLEVKGTTRGQLSCALSLRAATAVGQDRKRRTICRVGLTPPTVNATTTTFMNVHQLKGRSGCCSAALRCGSCNSAGPATCRPPVGNDRP